jgi:hypothetical protein
MTRRRALVIGTIAVLVAACSGGPGPTPTTTPGQTPVDTEPPAASPVTTTIDVNRTVWFVGFKLEIRSATLVLGPSGGTVTLDARFENVGESSATFDGTLVLSSADTSYEADDLNTDIPSVPAAGTGKGALAFRVGSDFTFDDAVLTVGLPSNNQAIIPFGSVGDLVTLEPVAVTVSGDGKAGTLQLHLNSGEIRADLPDVHSEVKAGHLVMTIMYDATFNSDFAGGFAFSAENVALRLPDGTTVGPRQDGRSQSIELLGPRTTTPDLFSRFEIDSPASGTYVLLVRNLDDEAEIEFEVP